MRKKSIVFLLALMIIMSINRVNAYASSDIAGLIFSENLESAYSDISDILFGQGNENYIPTSSKNQAQNLSNPMNYIKSGPLLDKRISLNSTNDNHLDSTILPYSYSNINERLQNINSNIKVNKVEEILIYEKAMKFTSNDMVKFAMSLIGTPYVYGGSTEKGFDCSGFVKYVYNHFEIDIPRSTYDMVKEGEEIDKKDLRPGDLVFFDTVTSLEEKGKEQEQIDIELDDSNESQEEKEDIPNKPTPSHVGMYIGDDIFIHSSSHLHKMVVLDYLTNSYYAPRIISYRTYR